MAPSSLLVGDKFVTKRDGWTYSDAYYFDDVAHTVEDHLAVMDDMCFTEDSFEELSYLLPGEYLFDD